MIDAFQYIIAIILFCLALIIAMIFGACSTVAQPITRTEYISTPTHCNIKMPQRPEMEDGFNHFTSNFSKILAYADELEMALHCCRGDKECFSNHLLDK